ncbi:MAG: nucleotidyltransferase domain-containing protein [Bacteroidales bacterium]|nr:nucleotidyltransferase domain-containing protein [Bacteroidales bacterium]
MSKNQISIKIRNVVKLYFNDADVMLFGSRAKGNYTEDSDYDVLIVTKQDLSVAQKTPLRTAIRKDLLDFGIRSDILVQSESEIERKKKLPGHFIRSIMKETILL